MNENEEYVIEESKDVALVVLNQTWQVPGKINIIYYQTSDSKVDFLYAIGKASGFGPSNYSMIQEHEEIPVITITDRPSDVSTLKHKEKALAYNTETSKWYMLEDIEENGIWTRYMTELISPGIYRNLDDGFRWFYNGTILKREDDFFSAAETEELVIQNIEYFKKPTLEITLLDVPEDTAEDKNNYYLPEDTEYIEKPGFTIRILNYKGEDDTSKYTISLDNDDPIVYEDGKYVVYRRYTEDFELPIKATKNNLSTTQILKFWFPVIAYWGSCVVSDIDQSIVPRTIRPKLIYHNLEKLDIDYELDNERSILYIPIDPSFSKFSHVYDRNGLDYINNYKYYPEYEYNGILYQVYCKNEPIVQNSLEQRFTYLDEFLDVPNSGWLRELDKEDYYTKEQIDEKFQDYPMIRLEGNKLIIGDREFKLTPWIDTADYYIGFSGNTRENFYSKTTQQLVGDSTPYMVQSTPTFIHEYTEEDNGLIIFYIILKFNVKIESGNLRSGNLVTEFTAEDFNNPTYFDVRYGSVSINQTAYTIIGVRGVSLSDEGNVITLNFIKY